MGVVFEVGYSFYEVFLRVFKDVFGVFFEMVRMLRFLSELLIMEFIKLIEDLLDNFEFDRFENGR